MDRSIKMSETESEIMEVLWTSEAPMSSAELLSYFAEHHGKTWKPQTLATFLARLAQKGLVSAARNGRVVYYYPIQTRESYRQSIAQEILDTLYQSSIKNFFVALCGNGRLSDKDCKELQEWLDKKVES